MNAERHAYVSVIKGLQPLLDCHKDGSVDAETLLRALEIFVDKLKREIHYN